MTKLRRLMKIATLGLLLGAIREEMNKPEAERTWHGTVGGVVPYDFRPPTFERIKSSVWSPQDERLITPHPWGVGWTINLGRLLQVLKGLRRSTV
ncbi:MAG TPA: DUF5808 domain-containing protein [Actinomycetota bacterium]|nr:DUF5808 domain-containing protein [Actinomycetota bacterium]